MMKSVRPVCCCGSGPWRICWIVFMKACDAWRRWAPGYHGRRCWGLLGPGLTPSQREDCAESWHCLKMLDVDWMDGNIHRGQLVMDRPVYGDACVVEESDDEHMDALPSGSSMPLFFRTDE